MENLKILLIVVLLMFSLIARSQITAVHHYLPNISADQARNYSSYDEVYIDQEVIFNSPNNLRLMRQLNPKIKIFCYINLVEWFDPMFPDKPWSINTLKELKKHPAWWLHGTNGQLIEFWPGTKVMNCRLDCKKVIIAGRKVSYIEFITKLFVQDVIGAYKREGIKLNGVLVDELFPTIDWLGNYKKNQSGIDSDGDRRNDNNQILNSQWQAGMIYLLESLRKTQGSGFVIIGNGGNLTYLKSPDGKILCNRKQFEDFPEKYLDERDSKTGAWLKNMNNASNMQAAIYNARVDTRDHKDNWFFTLCSAMLLDNTIFSHGQNMPYDKKYKLSLGQASEKFSKDGDIYLRKFSNGTVYVNPYNKTAWIKYKDGLVLK